MRACFAVRRAKGVAVRVDGNILGAEIYHWFDGNHHARLKFWPGAFFAEIWDIRVFVDGPAYPMSGKHFHNTVFFFLRTEKTLYRETNFSRGTSSPRRPNADLKRLFGDR